MKDNLTVKGKLTITITDKDGAIKDIRKINNLVVTTGKNWVVDQLTTTPTLPKIGYMGIGTGTATPSVSDITLQTEIDRNALTSKVGLNNILTMVSRWTAGDGTGAITEAGLFTASTSGVMISRTVFDVVNKGASDSLEIEWQLEFN